MEKWPSVVSTFNGNGNCKCYVRTKIGQCTVCRISHKNFVPIINLSIELIDRILQATLNAPIFIRYTVYATGISYTGGERGGRWQFNASDKQADWNIPATRWKKKTPPFYLIRFYYHCDWWKIVNRRIQGSRWIISVWRGHWYIILWFIARRLWGRSRGHGGDGSTFEGVVTSARQS